MTVWLIIHLFCKDCEPEIISVLIFPLAEQFHVHKSYKTLESTMLCIGNFKENIDLSYFHQAVILIQKFHKISWGTRKKSREKKIGDQIGAYFRAQQALAS